MTTEVDVLIVGGGPAGLSAATELKRLGTARVLVIDREAQLGGIPRHCHHLGFGWRDLRRVYSGPGYAAKRLELAARAGAELLSETTALGWTSAQTVQLTSPSGVRDVSARAILLATGCRERPRAARLIPGTRPLGVFTTGSLQRLLSLPGQSAGRRAVVVGAEHVSFSAVQSLTHTGTQVTAVVTDLPAHQTYSLYRWLTTSWHAVPVLTQRSVTRLFGHRRLEGVELTRSDGTIETLGCDSIVFSGDWIPDHELARGAGVVLDGGTRGPQVDAGFHTSVTGVFAAGNLLHGAETADVAGLEGTLAAQRIAAFLQTGSWPQRRVAITPEKPLVWVAPNAIAPGDSAPRLVFRVAEFLRDTALEARQGDRLLHRERYTRLVPNRWFHVSGRWLNDVDAERGNVRLSVHPC